MAFSALLQTRNLQKLHLYGHVFSILKFPQIRKTTACKISSSSSSSSGPQRYIPKRNRLSNGPIFKEQGDNNAYTQFDVTNSGDLMRASRKKKQEFGKEGEQKEEEEGKLHEETCIWPKMYNDSEEIKAKYCDIPKDREQDSDNVYTQFNYHNTENILRTSRSAKKIHKEEQRDEIQERLRSIPCRGDIVEESIQKPQMKSRYSSKQEEAEELCEVLFFPNEETIHVVEEESKRQIRPRLPKSSNYAQLRSQKPLRQSDIQSFIEKAKKAKLATSISVSSQMGEIHYSDDDGSGDGVGGDDDNDGSIFLYDEGLINESNEVKPFDSKQNSAKSTVAQEHAKNLAIRYLANRPYTSSELKKKLQSRDVTPDLANYAIKAVQNYGLQSDSAYAETFARARWNSGTWGPQRIRMGLKQRGVSDDIIQAAIDSVFCEDEPYHSHSNFKSMEISKSAMERLLMLATKQWNRGKNATVETKIRRMICWLQYRGFSQSVIRFVLNSVQR